MLIKAFFISPSPGIINDSSFFYAVLFVIYFFSAISFANHCNSGASHNGPDRQADQAGYMESNESAKTEKESKDESSEAMNKAGKDA